MNKIPNNLLLRVITRKKRKLELKNDRTQSLKELFLHLLSNLTNIAVETFLCKKKINRNKSKLRNNTKTIKFSRSSQKALVVKS
jgi:hypothetical protein